MFDPSRVKPVCVAYQVAASQVDTYGSLHDEQYDTKTSSKRLCHCACLEM